MQLDDTTINMTQPPHELLRIFFLQRQNDALEEIKEYIQRKAHSGRAPEVKIKATVQTLFLDLEPHLKANYKKKEYDELQTLIYSDKVEKVIQGYQEINQFLYNLNLKRVDTRRRYDTTNAEEENREVGL